MSDDELLSWAAQIGDAQEFGHWPEGDYSSDPTLRVMRAFTKAWFATVKFDLVSSWPFDDQRRVEARE